LFNLKSKARAFRSAKKDNLFPEVLLACALTPKRDLGSFAAGAVRHPLAKIRAKDVEIASYVRHLNKFTQDGRGAVLQQFGEKRLFGRDRAFRRNTVTSLRKPDACGTLAASSPWSKP